MFASLTSRRVMRKIAASLFTCCLIVSPALARAQQVAAAAQPIVSPKMEEAAKNLAADIVKYLAAEDQKSVIVESVRGPNQTVHAGMMTVLKQQLSDKGVKIVTAGAFTVESRMLLGDDGAGKTATRVNVKLLDALGAEKHQMSAVFTDTQDTINAFAPTFSNPAATAGAPAAQSAKVVGNAIKQSVIGNGAIFVAGSQIKADPGSPYGVELVVLDKNGYVSIPAEARDGLAVVDIQPQQEFGILIDNPTSEAIGVNVSLDGINMFQFSQVPHYRELGKVAVGPGRTGAKAAILKGWHDVGSNSFSFKVTDYGNSKAAKLGITEGVGTITITFYKAVEVKGSKGDKPILGIGAGGAVETKFTDVPLQFTEILGAVSVRYFRPTPPPDLPPLEPASSTATR